MTRYLGEAFESYDAVKRTGKVFLKSVRRAVRPRVGTNAPK